MKLNEKRCIPCEGGTPPLGEAEADALLKEIPSWSLREGHIRRTFRFKNFPDAIEFVNSVARLAEGEGHHPNITIRYNKVELELWTHAVKGLSENDFILAAKIDTLTGVGA
ncbi:MAG: 4a-hydroxytetrahydrobiopterin dehydratase [Nitrospirae bacterium]|nr:4a-hydroxytetrahydrobiopterin dehydratase [Nitrospirota bacterium]